MTMYAAPTLRIVPSVPGESLCCTITNGDNTVFENPACAPTGGFLLCNLPGIHVRQCEVTVGSITISG